MNTTPTPDPSVPPVGNVKVAFRMSREDYLKMEREFLPPNITDTTSILSAGQRLGLQVALAYFRREFVQGL